MCGLKSPIADMSPDLRARTRANYHRIRTQLRRLDDDGRAVLATAMLTAVADAAADRCGRASTGHWFMALAWELLAEDDSDPDDHGRDVA